MKIFELEFWDPANFTWEKWKQKIPFLTNWDNLLSGDIAAVMNSDQFKAMVIFGTAALLITSYICFAVLVNVV